MQINELKNNLEVIHYPSACIGTIRCTAYSNFYLILNETFYIFDHDMSAFVSLNSDLTTDDIDICDLAPVLDLSTQDPAQYCPR